MLVKPFKFQSFMDQSRRTSFTRLVVFALGFIGRFNCELKVLHRSCFCLKFLAQDGLDEPPKIGCFFPADATG